MTTRWVLAALAWLTVGVPAATGQEVLTRARALYAENRLEEAYPFFRDAALENSGSAEAHAWLAEISRRTERYDEARAAAHVAVAIDTCHAFALSVLATLYQPIYSDWEGTDADSAWAYYRRAVTCDPADGNTWTGLWMEALRRGDQSVEAQALRSLGTSGFLPDAVLAYNRWVLRSLPPRALLLTGGDWDTYPALAAQAVEGLRPDVGVVNLNMLNLSWYVRLVSTRYEVESPLPDSVMQRLESVGGLSGAVVEAWRARSVAGHLERPLAIAATAAPFTQAGGPGGVRDAGPYGLIASDATPPDTAAMRRALADLVGDDFSGPEVSAADRSPIRASAAAQRTLATNALWAGLRYAAALLATGASAEAALNWADGFVRDAGLGVSQQEMVEWVRDQAARTRDR